MKKSVMILMILITITAITGCSGVEWFPDGRQPTSFSFATISDTPLNSLVTSNATFIGGNTYSTTLTVTNGEISFGTTTTGTGTTSTQVWSSGTVTLPAGGANVMVRHKSASTAQTSTVTTISAGNKTSTFTSITKNNTSINVSAAVFYAMSTAFKNSAFPNRSTTQVPVQSYVSSIKFKLTLPPKAYLQTTSAGGVDPGAAFVSGLTPAGTASLELLQYSAPTPTSSASVLINLSSTVSTIPLPIKSTNSSTGTPPVFYEFMTVNMLFPAGATITSNAVNFSDLSFTYIGKTPAQSGLLTFKNISTTTTQ
jgi:hypothetical protein